jgi:uncharacterized protein
MTRTELLQELRAQLPYLREHYHITKLGLFGSYARNEQTANSDVDLLYELEPGYSIGFLEYPLLEAHLLTHLQVPRIDLVNAQFFNPLVAYMARKDMIYVQSEEFTLLPEYS